jgi:hypothetical protein
VKWCLMRILRRSEDVARDTEYAIQQMRLARIQEAEARTNLINSATIEKAQSRSVKMDAERFRENAIKTAKEALVIVGDLRERDGQGS